jgi:hypothetical protein
MSFTVPAMDAVVPCPKTGQFPNAINPIIAAANLAGAYRLFPVLVGIIPLLGMRPVFTAADFNCPKKKNAMASSAYNSLGAVSISRETPSIIPPQPLRRKH